MRRNLQLWYSQVALLNDDFTIWAEIIFKDNMDFDSLHIQGKCFRNENAQRHKATYSSPCKRVIPFTGLIYVKGFLIFSSFTYLLLRIGDSWEGIDVRVRQRKEVRGGEGWGVQEWEIFIEVSAHQGLVVYWFFNLISFTGFVWNVEIAFSIPQWDRKIFGYLWF